MASFFIDPWVVALPSSSPSWFVIFLLDCVQSPMFQMPSDQHRTHWATDPLGVPFVFKKTL